MPRPQDGPAAGRQDGPKQKKPGPAQSNRNQTRQWLKAHGHRAADVDREIVQGVMGDGEALLQAVGRLHGLSEQRLLDLMG